MLMVVLEGIRRQANSLWPEDSAWVPAFSVDFSLRAAALHWFDGQGFTSCGPTVGALAALPPFTTQLPSALTTGEPVPPATPGVAGTSRGGGGRRGRGRGARASSGGRMPSAALSEVKRILAGCSFTGVQGRFAGADVQVI